MVITFLLLQYAHWKLTSCPFAFVFVFNIIHSQHFRWAHITLKWMKNNIKWNLKDPGCTNHVQMVNKAFSFKTKLIGHNADVIVNPIPYCDGSLSLVQYNRVPASNYCSANSRRRSFHHPYKDLCRNAEVIFLWHNGQHVLAPTAFSKQTKCLLSSEIYNNEHYQT